MQTRRTLLQTVGAAGIVGIAGCSGGDSSGSSGGSSGDDSTESEEDEGDGEASSPRAWRSRDGGAGNTSANLAMAGPTSDPSTEVLYEPDSFDEVSSLPVVENGQLYFVTNETLIATSTDGEQQWEFGLGGSIGFGGVTPAVRDGTVFVPTDDSLVAVKGGERQWAVNPEGEVSSSVITTDQAVYVSTREAVYSYTMDGEERWSESFDQSVGRPAVDGSTVYVLSYEAFESSHLYALNASDGAEQWSIEFSGTSTVPVVKDGTVYALKYEPYGDSGVWVAAISGEDGSVLWESEPVSGNVVDTYPAVADGVVYLVSQEELNAFDASDGSAVWDSPYVTTGTTSAQPRVGSNSVYLFQEDSMVAVDRESGSQRWSTGVGDGDYLQFSGFSLVGGQMYLAAEDLYKLA